MWVGMDNFERLVDTRSYLFDHFDLSMGEVFEFSTSIFWVANGRSVGTLDLKVESILSY